MHVSSPRRCISRIHLDVSTLRAARQNNSSHKASDWRSAPSHPPTITLGHSRGGGPRRRQLSSVRSVRFRTSFGGRMKNASGKARPRQDHTPRYLRTTLRQTCVSLAYRFAFLEGLRVLGQDSFAAQAGWSGLGSRQSGEGCFQQSSRRTEQPHVFPLRVRTGDGAPPFRVPMCSRVIAVRGARVCSIPWTPGGGTAHSLLPHRPCCFRH